MKECGAISDFELSEVGSERSGFTSKVTITRENLTAKGVGKARKRIEATWTAIQDALQHLKEEMARDTFDSILKKLGWKYTLLENEGSCHLTIMCEDGVRDFEASTSMQAIEEALDDLAMAAIGALILGSLGEIL